MEPLKSFTVIIAIGGIMVTMGIQNNQFSAYGQEEITGLTAPGTTTEGGTTPQGPATVENATLQNATLPAPMTFTIEDPDAPAGLASITTNNPQEAKNFILAYTVDRLNVRTGPESPAALGGASDVLITDIQNRVNTGINLITEIINNLPTTERPATLGVGEFTDPDLPPGDTELSICVLWICVHDIEDLWE